MFTAGEEVGLLGAKALDLGRLTARRVFVLDSDGAPGTLIAARADPEARGRRVPRRTPRTPASSRSSGRSAIVAAARAVAAMRLGRLDDETTANIGLIARRHAPSTWSPSAARCTGEARSRDAAKVAAQVEHMVAGRSPRRPPRRASTSRSTCARRFRGYRHAPDSPLLRDRRGGGRRSPASRPRRVDGGGGSDANVFNAAGLPALTLGVGFENAHSPQECMSLERLARAVRHGRGRWCAPPGTAA